MMKWAPSGIQIPKKKKKKNPVNRPKTIVATTMMTRRNPLKKWNVHDPKRARRQHHHHAKRTTTVQKKKKKIRAMSLKRWNAHPKRNQLPRNVSSIKSSEEEKPSQQLLLLHPQNQNQSTRICKRNFCHIA